MKSCLSLPSTSRSLRLVPVYSWVIIALWFGQTRKLNPGETSSSSRYLISALLGVLIMPSGVNQSAIPSAGVMSSLEHLARKLSKNIRALD